MSAMKIKKGDTVKVIAGKDKGKEGKVLAVNVKDNTVVVEKASTWLQSTQNQACKPGTVESSSGRRRYRHLQRNVCSQRKSYKSWFQDGRRQKSTFAKSTGEVID